MAFLRSLYGEYVLLFLVLVTGFGTSVWAAWEYQRNAQYDTVMEFKSAAQDRIELITDKIEDNYVVLRSVAAFFQASDDVSREEFAIFTKQLLKDYPYIHTLEWIPHVSGPERAQYEANADYDGFKFTQGADGEELVPADTREEYFPIYFAEPMVNGNTKVLGFDVMSDPVRNAAVQLARGSRQLSATGRVHLLQVSDESVPGVIFYEPVIRKTKLEDGKEYDLLSGFIGSVLPLGDIVNAALKPLNYTGVNIVLHDLSAPEEGDGQFLHAHSTRLKDISQAEILEDYQHPGPLREQKVIDVGGRKWQITIIPTRGFFAVGMQEGSYLILVSGLLFTLLLVFYMFSRINENERISQEVQQRTEELLKAKRETEMILLSTHEGVTGLDQWGNITFCNPTASQLLGYAKKDLIGKNHHMLVHSKKADGSDYQPDSCPIQHILDYGQPCTVRNEVFWHKSGDAVKIEYSGAPILEGGEITGAVLVFRDITERLELEDKLEKMARYDQLTGLANRSLLIEHLKNALLRAERAKKKVAVVYLDLNGFKPINDTLGHAAGDLLLKKFADRLKDITRGGDIAARMGGDEFTILADNLTKEDDCLPIVDRIKGMLAKPFDIQGKEFMIGASIGIAFYPDHAATYEELISCADTAMYQAKKDKNGPHVIYSG